MIVANLIMMFRFFYKEINISRNVNLPNKGLRKPEKDNWT